MSIFYEFVYSYLQLKTKTEEIRILADYLADKKVQLVSRPGANPIKEI